MSAPIHGQEIAPDGHPVGSYADAAAMASAVVNDPSVIETIRKAAGIDDPDIVRVNADMLTIGEVEEVEEYAGQSIDMFARAGSPKAKFMRAMGMMVRRRTDPNFTWEQSYQLKVRMDVENPVPPTGGNGSAPSQSLPTNSA